MDRTRAALIAVAGLILTLLPGVTSPASAGPVDAGWSATGPGIVATTSDGSTSAARMTYNRDLGISGGVPLSSWDFTTTATPASATGPITVPYTWEGLHAWAGVTARMDMIVNGTVVGTLHNPPTRSCCESPSNGFLFGGTATFNVAAGQTYGFRLSGSNGDYNSFLRGSLVLSTKPYIESLGGDNRQWTGAEPLPAAAHGTAGTTGTLDEPGEARWWRFPVVPGEQVSVELTGLTRDYDLALYGDIEAAFERISDTGDLTRLTAGASASTAASEVQVPEYDSDVTTIPTKTDPPSTTAQFAPRVYAPRVYAPRVYAPRVYAPRVYAPRVYAPRVYAGDSFQPGLVGDVGFRDAFVSAQNQTLLAVSANYGTEKEIVSAGTGNTDGYFYVRVQGHDDKAFNKTAPFSLTRESTGGGPCTGLEDSDVPLPDPTVEDAETVILTDTERLGLAGDDAASAAYRTSLGELAGATDGVVVDLAGVDRVQELRDQADRKTGCPYAVNMAASAIRDLVNEHRNPALRYVVLAGGDEVVPFFRYPDTSGLGQESQFSPPLMPNNPAGASLLKDQVLSQDAYGSATDLTISGTSVPMPDLAVGRLVKTPDEIRSTIDHFVDGDGTLPTPTSSLVTGYDFLEDAAKAVQEEFSGALGEGGRADTLIEEYGTPHDESWTADDLRGKLLGERHDLVFLAGHFSANDALAADFDTAFEADELVDADGQPVTDPTAGRTTPRPLLEDSIVMSPGCHSGYQIVDGAAVYDDQGVPVTNTQDWTQRMAQHHAVLIGGTGYQYGDTDFLDYSERLYLGIARRLRTGPAGTPVAVGEALMSAKQDYLATLTSMSGIDQKAVLQATLYGLPMTGLDAPGRLIESPDLTLASPTSVATGPGATLGLKADDLEVSTGITSLDDARTKPSGAESPLPPLLTWFEGPAGVVGPPGAPVVPKKVVDVSVANTVLRGVGFRGGTYLEKDGLLPLTGAPAVEGTTPHTTFWSPAFFPQKLTSSNYFDALGTRGADGRTSLVLTPAQWRSDPQFDENSPDVTNTVRAYTDLGVRLFYNGSTEEFGGAEGNQPALAVAPAITDVTATETGRVVTFSARASGDPSAGVQQVWVTWTAGADPTTRRGSWQSVDLTQDPLDSTRWTGALRLPEGVARSGVRFYVQAVNGVGVVGLDTAEGDGYGVTAVDAVDESRLAGLTLVDPRPHHLRALADVTDADSMGLPGRSVRFTVSQLGLPVDQTVTTTDVRGRATYALATGVSLIQGVEVQVTADLLQTDEVVQESLTRTATVGDPATPDLTVVEPVTQAAPGISATVSDHDTSAPLGGREVRFVLERTDGTVLLTSTATTDATGRADLAVPAGETLPTGVVVVRAEMVGSTHSWSSDETTVTIPEDTLTVTPTSLTTVAGSVFPTLTATLTDARGTAVSGVPVTFTVPSGSTATFDDGERTATVVTNGTGKAQAPRLSSSDTGGLSTLTVSAPRATSTTVPLRAYFPLSDFVSPILKSGATTANLGSNVPVKVAALQANRARVTDAVGAALAGSGQVVLSWRLSTSTTWTGSTRLAYVPDKDFFQADLKTTSTAGFARKKSYVVRVTILPTASSTVGETDLGNREFRLTIG